jgi:hypothetical protein
MMDLLIVGTSIAVMTVLGILDDKHKKRVAEATKNKNTLS